MHRTVFLALVLFTGVWSVGASCGSDSRIPQFADLSTDGSFIPVEQGETLGGQVADEPLFVLYAGEVEFDQITAALRQRFERQGWTERPVKVGEHETVVFGDGASSACVSYSDMTAIDPFIPMPLTLDLVNQAKQEHSSVILMILFDCEAL